MVNGRRRKPAHYPLNIRHHGYGYSVKELADAIRYRRFADVLLLEYLQLPSALLLETLLVCLYGVLIVNGIRLAINPTFVRIDRFLVNFSDHQLYHMRIKNRAHIPRLIAALHIPEVITCDNGSIMPGEEAFLLLLYWFSFPRTLASAQEFYGLEYSQISRIIRTVIQNIMFEWQYLVDDNLDFFSPRFLHYSTAILYSGLDTLKCLSAASSYRVAKVRDKGKMALVNISMIVETAASLYSN